MRVLIRNRYRPFTHKPGAKVLVPGTPYTLHVFPAKTFVLEGETVVRTIEGAKITELDLEKGCVRLDGKALDFGRQNTAKSERISFGVFKKQDFELIQKRADMREVLPMWHALAKWMPPSQPSYSIDKERVIPLLKDLFLSGFQSLFFPEPPEFSGYPKIPGDPASLISEGAQLIRSLLFKHEGDSLQVLPLLPRELECGRMVGVQLGNLALFDCEWRSGRIIRAGLTCLEDGTLNLYFPKRVKSFRIDGCKRAQNGESVALKKGYYIFFDQFL